MPSITVAVPTTVLIRKAAICAHVIMLDTNLTLTITPVLTLMSVSEIQIAAVTSATTLMAVSCVFAPVDSDWMATMQRVWTSTSATLHHTAVVVSASTLKVPTTVSAHGASVLSKTNAGVAMTMSARMENTTVQRR